MRKMLNQAQTAGQYFRDEPSNEMDYTLVVEVSLDHKHPQNQRYASSPICATANEFSTVVTVIYPVVFCIFNVLAQPVAVTSTIFLSDGQSGCVCCL